MEVNEVKLGDIIYIQKYAPMSSEEEYDYHCSVVYQIKTENGKEYIYSKYENNGLSFKMLKDDIYIINNRYYINMSKYRPA